MQKSAVAGGTAARREGSAAELVDRLLGRASLGSLEAPEILSIGLTVVGVLLIGFSLATARLRLDDFGIAGSLSIAYTIGVACLPLAAGLIWVRPRRLAPLLVLQVALFVLTIWLTPLALEGTARFRTSYVSFGFLDPLLAGQGLQPNRIVYHNWPVFPLVMAAIVAVGHVSAQAMMGWFPATIILLYLVPLGALLQLTSTARLSSTGASAADDLPTAGGAGVSNDAGQEGPPGGIRAVGALRGSALRLRTGVGAIHPLTWVAGLWFFVVFDWTGQDYFSPQALAYLLFLAWATLLAYVALRREGQFDLPMTALAIAIFTAIVLTHVLTAMVALGTLIALTATRMARRPTLIVTCALIFLAWNVYVAAPFYRFYGDLVTSTLLALGDFFKQNLSNRVDGTAQHQEVALLRIVAALLAFGLGGLALLVSRVTEGRFSREVRLAVAFLIGIAVVAPVSVYGGEMLIRALLFGLPFLAILVVRAAGSRLMRWTLVAALVVMGPLQLITHYGNERYDYVSPDELAGFQFVENLGQANVFGGFPSADFRNVVQLDWRNAVVPAPRQPLSISDFQAPQNHKWRHPEWPVYVALSRGDIAAAEIFYKQGDVVAQVQRLLASSPSKYKLVFSNPDFVVYRWLGAPPTSGGKP